jgi:hypothetical protein
MPSRIHFPLGKTITSSAKTNCIRALLRFKEWVGKDAWKLNRWKARGKVPAITKEELDRIKVKY